MIRFIVFNYCIATLGLLAGISGRSLASESAYQKTNGMEVILSQDLGNHRIAKLCARKLQLEIGSAAKKHVIPGRFLWIEINDECSGKSRYVWREWFPIIKNNCGQLRDFLIYQRDQKELAFALIEGSSIRFWQIELNINVDVDQESAVDYAKNIARVAGFANTPTNIPVPQILKAAKINGKLQKIISIAWKDGNWQVQLHVGNEQIVFVRGPSDSEWQLVDRIQKSAIAKPKHNEGSEEEKQ